MIAARLKEEKSKRPLIKDLTDEGLRGYISDKLEERNIYYVQSVYHLETIFLSNDNFERILRRNGS